jgi:hypothetical protein
VVVRKLGGCNKTLQGALVHGILASLMVSVQQHGKRFLELALGLWRQPIPQPLDWSGEPVPETEPEDPAEPDLCRRRDPVQGIASG